MHTPIDEYYILEAMEQYGGSFVYHLAMAARAADRNNYNRLRNTFSEYWDEYTKIAKDRLIAYEQ